MWGDTIRKWGEQRVLAVLKAWTEGQPTSPWSESVLRIAKNLAGHDENTQKAEARLEEVLAEQQRTIRELAESEARFREVFRRVPNVLIIARLRDALIYEVNEQFENVTGFKREDVVGRCSSEFSWWKTPEEAEENLGRMREQGQLKDTEMRFLHHDGSEHFALVSASPITMHGEECIVWHAVDITELKRAEANQRALEERLRKKQNLEKLGTVAGAIAHDFNNLLVSILGNADMVLLKLAEDSPLRAPMQAIVASAQRAAERTRELLDYAGRGGGQLKPLDLARLLEEVADAARAHLPAHATLRLEKRAGPPVWIAGDASQLTRMFLNLIKNAAEALDEGGHEIELELTCTPDGRACVLLRDQGRGMSSEGAQHMFDPFASAAFEKRGFGLVSVPGIVERHGGTVSVESKKGVGTTICVHFPLAEGEFDSKPHEKLAPPDGHKGRVLVVDDESQVRAVAAAMLGQLGFETVQAESGTRALELIEQTKDGYACVMLDATMPDMDGVQVLERLRASHPALPVLLCSGYSRTDFTGLLGQRSRVSFLTKPFRLDELAQAVHALLS